MKKAWRIRTSGFPDGVVAAETRGQAIAKAFQACGEVGYNTAWKDHKATRAPEFDKWAELDETGACWDEKLLPR